MSFSRSKLARFSESKDGIGASIKASTTSTSSKLITKANTDKVSLPQSARTAAKLPRPIRHRSLSRPPSPTTNVKSQRPCSVSGIKTLKQNKEPLDLDKADDDLLFKSATILPFADCFDTKDNGPLEEIKSNGSSPPKDIHSSPSETTKNTSAIPLRVKSSQVSNKESVKESVKMPREAKKITSTSHLSHLSNSTTPRRTNVSRGNVKTGRNSTLIHQFEDKKRQLHVLQNELTSKRSLVSELYTILVELKKKLEESGVTNVELDDLKPDIHPASVEPRLIETMTDAINEIPSSLGDICRNLMNKRLLVLTTLEQFTKHRITVEEAQRFLKTYKEDTTVLEKMVSDQSKEQQNRATSLVEKWALLVSNSGDAVNILNDVDELKAKLKAQEQKLNLLKRERDQALKSSETYEKKTSQVEATVEDLNGKLKHLEQALASEKQCAQSHKEKYSSFEQQKKTMKTQIQELERKCKESETKQSELQKTCKHTQEQLKVNELRWNKEKEELVSKGRHDKQMLEKLTKERSCFETRVKTLEENLAEVNNGQKSAENKLNMELEATRKLAAEEKVKRETLEEKYEHVQNKLIQMEIGNSQLVDIAKTKNTFEPNDVANIYTEHEAELYTELMATRAALKAAEDKLQSYDREKMRFINTLESLQDEKDVSSESILSLKNVQRLTELESSVAQKDETVYRQQVEITGLKAEVEELKLKISIPESGESDLEENELKRMLYDGKSKLEALIKKSSQNEQKAISFQHELDKRTRQLNDMENLLKVRDGLIKLLKAKKDDLQIESNSLNKYGNTIRELLLQTREEMDSKTKLLHDLTMNLNSKERENEAQVKRIHELEHSLSIANEKRFKLQDAVGVMEKELQLTKAQLKGAPPSSSSWYDTASPRKFTLPKNRSSFTYSNRAKIGRPTSPTYGSQPPRTSTLNFATSAQAPTDADASSHYLESEVVRSWLSSYQNVDDIQKRLKFLKHAFASLSRKMVVQDTKLKQTAKSLMGTCHKCHPRTYRTPKVQASRHNYYKTSPTTSQCEEFSQQHTSPIPKLTKIQPTPDLYYNRVIKKNLPKPPLEPQISSSRVRHNYSSEKSKTDTDLCNVGTQSSAIPNRSSQILSSIPIPKVRFSPLTLSSRPPVTPVISVESRRSYAEASHDQFPKGASENLVDADRKHSYKSYLSLFLNRGGVRPSSQEGCHQLPPTEQRLHSVPDVAQYRISQPRTSINMRSCIQIETQDSSADSNGSNLSVATVIECSELINTQLNDMFISESEYVLKLHADGHNFAESGDYATVDDIQYLETDVASSSNVPKSLSTSQYLCVESDWIFD
ncbi:COP1-interactive protein 1-like isoform X1 [Photinus pyralis]|uniref:COP1-interactive protein 1-like isoform X1 n=1 Tax=Photinus pyralis TaxID=7054 RepID=UPI0012676A95|nr:COP1-interactive protein 1-like isoform X1 [Photinus pyralis]XP_031341807.1 COP1-interactive protein 1-like isoform X1 [Photinus pyralis]